MANAAQKAQKLLNKTLAIANQIHQNYITHGAFIPISFQGNGWPAQDEIRAIIDKIDDALFSKFGMERTVWSEEHKQPTNTKGEWRWIMDAYYRHLDPSEKFLMVGIELEVEPAIYLIPQIKSVLAFPLSDPDCFEKFNSALA